MRDEIFKLWHLIQKRQALLDSASCISSPGFEMSYSSGRRAEAPYEDKVIAACDLQDEIDETALSIVHSYENDNNEILKKVPGGQRQRALRLCFICGKSDAYIAGRLGINIRTVETRLKGVTAEKAPEGKFAVFCLETKLLPIDAEIEEYLATTYDNVERMVEEHYPEVDRLIVQHYRLAQHHRKRYRERMEYIEGVIDGMEGKAKAIMQLWIAGEKNTEIAKKVDCSTRYVKMVITGL